MILTEKVDKRAVSWLLSMLSPEFIFEHICDGEIGRFNFTYIKKILQNYEKNDGIVQVKYSKKDKFGILRDYGEGIQNLPTKFRGLICKNMTDCDIKNCHPQIIYNLCKKHNIECKYLEDYITNRKTLIEEGRCSKMDILKSMNKKQPLKVDDGWLKQFDLEMKHIQIQLMRIDEYQQCLEMAQQKPRNVNGIFMSNLATSFEVKILHCITENIRLDYAVLMFDGFMVYDQVGVELLTRLSQLIKDKLDLDVEFDFKPHDDTLEVPEDFVDTDTSKLYENLKIKYEKDYCLSFIEKNCMFSYKINGRIQFYTQSDLNLIFANVLIKESPFLKKWMKDTERQTYSEVGVYPHDVVCPENILNIWDGFAVEQYPESNADISPILNHLRIITKEENVYEFILDWLANMFQYPSNKSVMIVIQGQEGSGKSVLCDFITKMMGESAIEVNDVKERLFGRFNSCLSRKVFVNINETERKDMNQFFERMKALITSPTIDIEEKGQKTYTEQSLLHFLSTLNNDNVFKITKDSRRYCYIETSNELCGNTDYFADLFAFIEKKSNQRAFYDFLMNREVKKRITEKDIPETQAMIQQYELNRDPIEDYAIEFDEKRNASENYNAFKMFMKEQGLEYVMSKKLFEMRFNKIMNNYGIEKKRLIIDGARGTYYYKPSLEEQADQPTDATPIL
jgi:hypothetical protein